MSYPARLFLAILFCAIFGAARSFAADDVQHIQHAQFIVSASPVAPAHNADWQEVRLPHRLPRAENFRLTDYWYRVRFSVPANADRVMWLFLPKLRSGGLILVNGIPIHEVRRPDALTLVRWFQPHLVAVPSSVLHAGMNQMDIQVASRETATGLGNVYFGPVAPIRKMYELRLLWESTMRTGASVLCFLVGGFAIVFWCRRRSETLYAVFGTCAVMWGARNLLIFFPEIPMQYWTAWRAVYYFTTGGFISCITLFLLQFAGFAYRPLNRFLVLYWLGGTAAFLVFGLKFKYIADVYWLAGFLPFVAFALCRLTVFAWHTRTLTSASMWATTVVAMVLAVHDFLVQNAWIRLPENYWLHFGIPAFLITMLWAMLERFIASLEQLESMNDKLEIKVRQREQQILLHFERLRELEKRQAASEERHRIMQDMHDGLGSRLLSALVMVQRIDAVPTEVSSILMECMDEMRIVIDALSPDDTDLVQTLATFRYRMEPRLKRAGLKLHWRSEDLPADARLDPGTLLHVLRILQEAITNVLKHAAARNIFITSECAEEYLRIVIQDDGQGTAKTSDCPGRGMLNMKNRAEKIGARLEATRLASGFRVSLAVPVPTTSS